MCAAPNTANTHPRYTGCRTQRYTPDVCRPPDAGQLQRVDPGDRACDDPHAGELNRRVRNGAEAGRVIQVAANRPPRETDDDEQEAGNPDVHTPKQAGGHDLGERGFHAVAREDAVMRGK